MLFNRLIILAFFLIMELAASSAEVATTATWRVIWFPSNDTFPSWDWTQADGYVHIESTSYPFPEEIKLWELRVVSSSDARKKAMIPLNNPYNKAENSLLFQGWIPGFDDFKGQKLKVLEALGKGTFHCAIFGDGKRLSNVARVTIQPGYQTPGKPIIRLVALQPFGPNDPISCIGAWIIPPSPGDVHLTTIASQCPTWEINGTWRIAMGDLNGRVVPLTPGVCRGHIYRLPSTESNFSFYFGFEPRIEPFTEAKVRLRIADKYNSFEGLPLTAKQTELIARNPVLTMLQSKNVSNPSLFKTYISDVFELKTDEQAITQIEQAFLP